MSETPDPRQAVAALAARLADIDRIVGSWNAAAATDAGADPLGAAGADQVSVLIAAQFNAYARHYRQVAGQAGHDLHRLVAQWRDGLQATPAGEVQTSNR